ncbi:MAG: AraC family transcriptional regulator [Marivirga sp.]|nr:AraC family transcriptional regulator [Marivirga sp.]
MNEQRKQFLLGLLGYSVQRGISAEELCVSSGIDLNLLTHDSNYEMSRIAAEALWRNAGAMIGDPLFGLHFGESVQLAALGAVGEIIKNSQTVGEAITIAASFTPVVTDLFQLRVDKLDRSFQVTLIDNNEIADDFVKQQVADFLMVFTIHELNGFILKKIVPRSVHLKGPILAAAEYERVFRCKPVQGSGSYSIDFDLVYWNEPIQTANYEMQKFFIQKVNASLQRTATSSSFQTKIMEYLMKNAYLGLLSVEDVAANFNMTPRSLQRKLQNEAVTFQQLADTVRKSLALHYLESGKYQIKEISHMLGYNEISAFSRAFKRWTGKPPLSYQA